MTENFKFYRLLFLCFLCGVYSQLGSSCSNNTQCTQQSKQIGFCLSRAGRGKCSCLSGFGGACDSSGPYTYASSSCLPEKLSLNSVNFAPSLNLSFESNSLKYSISLPYQNPNRSETPRSESTWLIFSAPTSQNPGNGTPCDMPYGDGVNGIFWNKSSPNISNSCKDVYDLVMPWSQATMNCGFVSLPDDPDYFNYGSKLWIRRTYDLGSFGIRTINLPFPILVKFPKFLSVWTNISIESSPIGLFVMTLGISFNASTNTWEASVLSSISSQYELYNPIAIDSALRLNGTNLTNCTISNSRCYQTTTLYFGSSRTGSSCDPLDTTVDLSYLVSCASSDNSCFSRGTIASSRIYISTTSSCPLVVSVEARAVLNSYSDSNFSNPTASFNFGDTGYFLVSVESDRAIVTNISPDYGSLKINGLGYLGILVLKSENGTAGFAITFNDSAIWRPGNSAYEIYLEMEVEFLGISKRYFYGSEKLVSRFRFWVGWDLDEIDGGICRQRCILFLIYFSVGFVFVLGLVCLVFYFWKKTSGAIVKDEKNRELVKCVVEL